MNVQEFDEIRHRLTVIETTVTRMERVVEALAKLMLVDDYVSCDGGVEAGVQELNDALASSARERIRLRDYVDGRIGKVEGWDYSDGR